MTSIRESAIGKGQFLIDYLVPGSARYDDFGRYILGTGRVVAGSQLVQPNMILDSGGETLIKYLANDGTPQAAGAPCAYMAKGTGTTAAAHDDEGLETEVGTRVANTLTRVVESASSAYKVLQAVGVFPAVAGHTAITEFMLVQNAVADTPSADIPYNRAVVSPARDNENNDLRVTYQSLLFPVT